MKVEIWLTEPYFREYQDRKGVLFNEEEKYLLFELTQALQRNWPVCAIDPNTPPEVGTCARLYYIKCNFNSGAVFRVCFLSESLEGNSVIRLVALTARTKQELASGSKSGTVGWYDHIETIGLKNKIRYLNKQVRAWKIY